MVEEMTLGNNRERCRQNNQHEKVVSSYRRWDDMGKELLEGTLPNFMESKRKG